MEQKKGSIKQGFGREDTELHIFRDLLMHRILVNRW